MMPSVAGLIRNFRGELLLQKKSDGSWSLPAGAIEPSETPEQAIKREVLEETGYTVSSQPQTAQVSATFHSTITLNFSSTIALPSGWLCYDVMP